MTIIKENYIQPRFSLLQFAFGNVHRVASKTADFSITQNNRSEKLVALERHDGKWDVILETNTYSPEQKINYCAQTLEDVGLTKEAAIALIEKHNEMIKKSSHSTSEIILSHFTMD